MPVEMVGDAVLLPVAADWDGKGPTWTLKWDTEIVATLKASEGRGALRRLPRPTLSLPFTTPTVEVGAALLARLRAALPAGGRCAVPWHGRASFLVADAAAAADELRLEETPWPWAAGDALLVFSADLADYATATVRAVGAFIGGMILHLEGALPALPRGAAVYPLFYGRAEPGEDTLHGGRMTRGTLKVTGDRYEPAPADAAAATFLDRPIFPLPYEWSTEPTRRLDYNARVSQVGFGPERVEPLQAHAASGFTLQVDVVDPAALRRLEGFAQLGYGRLRGFWLPAPAPAAEITGPGADGRSFVVAGGSWSQAWQDHPARYLFLRQTGLLGLGEDGSGAGLAVEIAGIAAGGDGTEVVSTVGFLPEGGVDATWDVFALHYVRFAADELAIAFDGESYAGAEIKVVELPVEYQSVELGLRPTFLYHLWRVVGGARQDWRWTSFDEPVFSGSEQQQSAWLPAGVGHEEAESNVKGDRESLTLSAWLEEASPFAAWLPYAPTEDLFVEVFEHRLDAGGYSQRLFSGVVEHVKPTGKRLTVECATRLDRLAAPIPRFRVQKNCNYCLYDPNTCRVRRADWSVQATVDEADATGQTLALVGGGVEGKAADWFVNGDLDLPGGELRMIIADGGADARGRRIITLLAPPAMVPAAGAAVTLAAGCDLTVGPGGCGKFGNLINYGGHPFIDTNLNLKAIKLASGQGGKGGGK